MKKKSPRGIPDFSSKGPKSMPMGKFMKDKGQPQPKPVANNPVNIKPPSTSQKSGRRGG